MSHKFPLRQYYVQLQWKKKTRTPMGSETVTLTSLYDLIKDLQLPEACSESPDAGARPTACDKSSVMIEGKHQHFSIYYQGLSVKAGSGSVLPAIKVWCAGYGDRMKADIKISQPVIHVNVE